MLRSRVLISSILGLVLPFGLIACVTEGPKPAVDAPIRHMQCPPENMVSSAITRAKPTSAEDMVRQSIAPPVVSGNQPWSVNSYAIDLPNLYLSCYYSSRKMMTYKLPLDKEFCMAKENKQNYSIECVKK